MGHDGLSVTSIADARLHGEILQQTGVCAWRSYLSYKIK